MTPLRQRMIEDMQLRGMAAATQKQYIAQVANFASYFGLSPEVLDTEAIRQYQLYLINERKVSPESANTFISAVKFLYLTTLELPWTDEYFPRVRRPYNLPVVLSQEEVLAFFDHIPALKYRAALMTCYGAGLRVSEAVALKIADIDSQRNLLRIEQGKGHKDRYAMLSPRLLEVLRRYYRAVPAARHLLIPFLAQKASPQLRFFTDRLPRSRYPRRHSKARYGPYPCATRSRLTCWRTAPICGLFKCCSVTRVSTPPRVMSPCRRRWLRVRSARSINWVASRQAPKRSRK